jgi:hypothetical protein
MWSPDSNRFAITHYVGGNSSEVFVVNRTRLEKDFVTVRSAIEINLAPHLTPNPVFVKAYRWTKSGELIVRGIGRALEAPYERFGCEVVVSFTSEGSDIKFLRGYILAEQ